MDAAEHNRGQLVRLGFLDEGVLLSGEEGLELVFLVVETLEFEVVVELAAVEDVFDLPQPDLLHLLDALFSDQLDLDLALGLVRLRLLIGCDQGRFAAVHAVEVHQLLHVFVPDVFGLLSAQLRLLPFSLRLLTLDGVGAVASVALETGFFDALKLLSLLLLYYLYELLLPELVYLHGLIL